MRARTLLTGSLLAAGTAVAAAAAYPRFAREWCLTWGATADEAARHLPGDDLVPRTDIVSTRGITIDAPAAAVWPWLVQLGPGRGGAYTYDWIENLFGLDMHSADRILPEHQDLTIGDVFALGRSGPRMEVAVLQRERALVYRSQDGHWSWAFVLDEDAAGRTRLLSRNRIASPDAGPAGRLVNTVVMEPGSLVMERMMLLGIKERAERPD